MRRRVQSSGRQYARALAPWHINPPSRQAVMRGEGGGGKGVEEATVAARVEEARVEEAMVAAMVEVARAEEARTVAARVEVARVKEATVAATAEVAREVAGKEEVREAAEKVVEGMVRQMRLIR